MLDQVADLAHGDGIDAGEEVRRAGCRTDGSRRARAISTRRRSPPDRRDGRRVADMADAELGQQVFDHGVKAGRMSGSSSSAVARIFCSAVRLAEDRSFLRQVADAAGERGDTWRSRRVTSWLHRHFDGARYRRRSGRRSYRNRWSFRRRWDPAGPPTSPRRFRFRETERTTGRLLKLLPMRCTTRPLAAIDKARRWDSAPHFGGCLQLQAFPVSSYAWQKSCLFVLKEPWSGHGLGVCAGFGMMTAQTRPPGRPAPPPGINRARHRRRHHLGDADDHVPRSSELPCIVT